MKPPPGFLRAHPSAPFGAWSDDGAQALCLLASLLYGRSLDIDDFARRLVNWYEHGYMAHACARLLKGHGVSAGFDFDGETFWGSNGSVEAYLESLRNGAERAFGPTDPLTVFFCAELDGFFPGKVVFLDECLQDEDVRRRFVRLLDEATAELLRTGAFTDLGRSWVATVITRLRQRIAEAR